MIDRRSRRTGSSQARPAAQRAIPVRVLAALGGFGAFVLVLAISQIGGSSGSPAASSNPSLAAATPTDMITVVGSETLPSPLASSSASPPSSQPPSTLPPSTLPSSPDPTTTPASGTVNLYAGAGSDMFSPTVAAFPPRVYVPDEASGTVVVIDPNTFKILFRYKVGASPEHVTPDWDLKRLYVEASFGGRLTVIDPATGRAVGHHAVPGPYNLYFTLDGRMAIVVLDSSRSGRAYGGQRQLYFYDRLTWRLIKALDIPFAGADHLDFSADGSFFLLSTEYTGRLVRVDVQAMRITGTLNVGGKPIDVRLAPDGRDFFVANQGTNGVSIIDAAHLRQVAFLRTGRGAHGLAISRDSRQLFVTNRLAGSLSVIDLATKKVIRTWRIGGSPDMIAVSPDGKQLWISNRYGGTVSVVDAHTGHVIKLIRVGGRPHGLAYFPEPGSLSLGHNGIYR